MGKHACSCSEKRGVADSGGDEGGGPERGPSIQGRVRGPGSAAGLRAQARLASAQFFLTFKRGSLVYLPHRVILKNK